MCVCVCFSLQVPTATVLVSIIWGSDKYMSIFASWDGRTRSSVIWLRVVGWLVGWLAGFWCLLWSVWPCSFCKDIESIWCRATSMADSVIPSDRVIIRYMPTGTTYSLTRGLNWGGGFFFFNSSHFQSLIFGTSEGFIVWTRTSAHTSYTGWNSELSQ